MFKTFIILISGILFFGECGFCANPAVSDAPVQSGIVSAQSKNKADSPTETAGKKSEVLQSIKTKIEEGHRKTDWADDLVNIILISGAIGALSLFGLILYSLTFGRGKKKPETKP